MAKPKEPTLRTVCVHRKARFDYEIVERVELGLVLLGAEVKALREGKGNLTDAYVAFRRGHPTLINLEISAYSHDRSGQHVPRRPRALLAKAAEARRLEARCKEKGLTLVPLSVYFKGPWAKVEVALARGKSKGDKRQVLKKREAMRDIDRDVRRRH